MRNKEEKISFWVGIGIIIVFLIASYLMARFDFPKKDRPEDVPLYIITIKHPMLNNWRGVVFSGAY